MQGGRRDGRRLRIKSVKNHLRTQSERCSAMQLNHVVKSVVYKSSVDDSLFLGTWTDKQSSIPYHNVFDAGPDFVTFFSLRSDMSAIGCGDGIREEGLRDDFFEFALAYIAPSS
ncbi:hypothetical protein TNCV_1315601 [Trichonephila clavipes]|uniref:Uncharacterized protein n=1 Tax=Trichonephila clavipes TaxID=2585209 RepID=A0A8X6SLT5_TRICX|nr:hypothetical protein TNCV_1315601 [Trichonephila clavipes]